MKTAFSCYNYWLVSYKGDIYLILKVPVFFSTNLEKGGWSKTIVQFLLIHATSISTFLSKSKCNISSYSKELLDIFSITKYNINLTPTSFYAQFVGYLPEQRQFHKQSGDKILCCIGCICYTKYIYFLNIFAHLVHIFQYNETFYCYSLNKYPALLSATVRKYIASLSIISNYS